MFQDPMLIKILVFGGAFLLFLLWLTIDFSELKKKKK